MLDGGDAGRIIAAIFEPLQRIDDQRRHRRVAHNPDDAAHVVCPRFPPGQSFGPYERIRTDALTYV